MRFQNPSFRFKTGGLVKGRLTGLRVYFVCQFYIGLFFLAFYPSLAFSEQSYNGSGHEGSGYAGSGECRQCHRQQFADWQGSHHDLAMQPTTPDTVLGDFNGAVFQHQEVQTRFYKKGEEFWLRTDNIEGELEDFKVVYTFGVTPLQQYLLDVGDGRLQAFTIAWDSRSKAEGGQRWFHLYPDTSGHQDILHWTRQSNNWNSGCAECHSTDLQKNYQAESNSYQTRWAELDVACEACHGPAAAHIDWARSAIDPLVADISPGNTAPKQSKQRDHKGFETSLARIQQWSRPEGQATAQAVASTNTKPAQHSRQRLSGQQLSVTAEPYYSPQIERCAQCHSRRTVIGHPARDGNRFADLHQLQLLEPPFYYVDGQIRDEVFVYGSFLQSKMYQRGVVCSDCHNPHSLVLKAEGNALCTQCHSAQLFDQSEHHHHQSAQSSGAQCVNCHMPETTYMRVDPRRDHSLRIPRPDLSQSLGVPNACNQCHQDKSVEWALDHFQQWYPQRVGQPHFARHFHATVQGDPQALPQLARLADDESLAAMVRASALSGLSHFPSQYAINTAAGKLSSADALMRRAAVELFEMLPKPQRAEYLLPLLDDPVKAVRQQVVRLLAGLQLTDEALQSDLMKAVEEYRQSLQYIADIPGGLLQAAVFYQELGDYDAAFKAYRQALRIEPAHLPALLNLADLYRLQQQDGKAKPLLEKALQLAPASNDANYAMGLLRIRLQDYQGALPYLGDAAKDTENPLYSYVHAVALYETGHKAQAIQSLKAALGRFPNNQELQNALRQYQLRQ